MGKAKQYYEAVFTDSGTCLIGCGHKHQNIVTATACISQPAGYVVGVNRWGKFRELNSEEEAEFHRAMFGHGLRPDSKPPLGVKNIFDYTYSSRSHGLNRAVWQCSFGR